MAVRALRLAAPWLRPLVWGAMATPGCAEHFPAGVLACPSWVRRLIADVLRVLDLSDAAMQHAVACELEAVWGPLPTKIKDCRRSSDIGEQAGVSQKLGCQAVGSDVAIDVLPRVA